jgi:hypothetical protein
MLKMFGLVCIGAIAFYGYEHPTEARAAIGKAWVVLTGAFDGADKAYKAGEHKGKR